MGLFTIALLAAVASAHAVTPLVPAWTHPGGVGSPGVFETLGTSAIIAGPQTLDRVDLATGKSTLLNNGAFDGQPSFNTAKTKMIVPILQNFYAEGLVVFDVATGNNVTAFAPAGCNSVDFTYYDGLFIGLCPGIANTVLAAVSADTAEFLWRIPLQFALASPVALDTATGLIFTSDMNQTVFAVDARTGATKWSSLLPTVSTQQPTLCGGRIVVGTLTGVVGMDPMTGSILWRMPSYISSLTLVPLKCAVRPNGQPFVFLATSLGNILAYHPSNGTLLFRTNATTVGGTNCVLPLHSPRHELILTFGKHVGRPQAVIGVVSVSAGSLKAQYSVPVSPTCSLGLSTVIAVSSPSSLRVLFACNTIFAIDIPLK